MGLRDRLGFQISLLYLASAVVRSCLGCSVLSHEAIVDALWDIKLKPALLARFPKASPDDLKHAQGYAYGGAIIQDLGYYPHGSKKFSDMTHYVRTGDFVVALVKESHTLNELAFALGAASHYFSDIDVHRSATNPGEAILYPNLEHKFGKIITYEQDPAAHLKTEFGFDVLEVAKGRFAPEAYHSFIGFSVAGPLLDRAFHDTYGLDLSDLFPDFARTMGSYRRAVSKTIPAATRVAWAQRKDEIQHSERGITRSRFIYVMKRSSYERSWGKQYDRPTMKDRILAVALRLIPPVGPLRTLQFKMPTPPVERLFMQSFAQATAQFGAWVDYSRSGQLRLDNVNYDVGQATKRGGYKLEDGAYVFWLDKLANKNFSTATPQIRAALIAYYQNFQPLIKTEKHAQDWKHVQAQLAALRTAAPNSIRAAAGAQ